LLIISKGTLQVISPLIISLKDQNKFLL
jgi:hypothetical protein